MPWNVERRVPLAEYGGWLCVTARAPGAVVFAGRIPASKALADRLIATGYAGMRARGFAVGAGVDDLNLVMMWEWGSERPAGVVLSDDEGRLSGSPAH